eukprot:10958083-Lingulodinium_polyedra.AAC.1
MRVLRRIAGEVRMDAHSATSDREVRERLHVPSIDSVLQRMRSLYLARVERGGTPALVSLL